MNAGALYEVKILELECGLCRREYYAPLWTGGGYCPRCRRIAPVQVVMHARSIERALADTDPWQGRQVTSR